MNEPKDQQEPSMEEILSSIRRIIADEESEERNESEAGPALDREDRPADEDDEDVLELTEVVRESGDVVEFQAEKQGGDEAAGADDETPEGEEVELTPDERNEPMPQEQSATPPAPSAGMDEGVMSAAAAGAAAGSTAKLGQAMRDGPGEPGAASGKTVEQFVGELLSPMLQAWLEENLPPIVERAVQDEIEKLAKRAELL